MIQKLIPRLLNKEADETLVRPNEFSDAVNVKVEGDVGVDAGVIKYADGNEVISFNGTLTASGVERVVGVCEDETTDTIYVFTSGAASDSIFFVKPDGSGSYVFNLLVRSSLLELDPSNFTAANIIRVYEKQIESVGLDSLTGTTFFDGQEITDFADEGSIEEVDDTTIGSALFNVVPQLTQVEDIFITQEQLAGAAPFSLPNQFLNIFNQGNQTGTATITYSVTNTNPSYGGYETSVLPSYPDDTITFSAGQQKTVTLGLSGFTGADDGDIIDFSVQVVTSSDQVFQYEWSAVVSYVSLLASDPVFTPTNLDHGDFGSVTEGVPTSISKTYSISNPVIPNLAPDEAQADYSVEILILESGPDDADGNAIQGGYSYLQYVDENESIILTDGDGIGSELSLIIPVGETREFTLNVDIPSNAGVGVFEWAIEVKFVAQGGVLPPSIDVIPGATFTGLGQSLSVIPELEDPEILPAVVGFGGDGFDTVSPGVELDPVDQIGYYNGSTIQNIAYTFVENNPQFQGTWTLAMEPTLDLDPSGWFAQHGGQLLKFSTSAIPGQNGSLQGVAGPLNPLSWVCNAGSTSVVNAAASSASLPTDAETDLINVLLGNAAVAAYTLRWYVLETNATLITETLAVIVNQIPENPSIEVAIATNGTGGQETIPFSSLGTNGVETVSQTVGPFDFTQGTDFDKCVVVRIRNNGSSDLSMPEVRLSNTRMQNPNGFSYLGAVASSTYVSDSGLNGDYTNNNVAWTGFGSNISGSTAGDQRRSQGYSDIGGGNGNASIWGWHPLCYGVIKGSVSDGRDATLYRYYHGQNSTGGTSGGWGSSTAPGGLPRSVASMKEDNPFWTAPDDPYTSDVFTFKMFDINFWNRENGFPAGATPRDYSCFLDFPIGNYAVLGQSYAVNNANETNVLAEGDEVKILLYPYGDGVSNLTAFVEVIPPSGSIQQNEQRTFRYKIVADQAGALPPPKSNKSYTGGSDPAGTIDPLTQNQYDQQNKRPIPKPVSPQRVTISDKSTASAVRKAKIKKYK